MSGVEEGSVPLPVACGLLTVSLFGSNTLCSISVIVPLPTLPTLPGVTATTFAVAVPFQGTRVSLEFWKNSIPLVFFKYCPYLRTIPLDPQSGPGHGAGTLFGGLPGWAWISTSFWV